MKHLSDDLIQEYLDGNALEGRTSIEAHLDSCENCRTRKLHYQRLYVGLDAELEEQLSMGFADSVLANVESELESSLLTKVWDFLPVVFGAIIGMAALFYFLDFQLITSSFESFKIPDFYTPVFTQVKEVSGGLDFGLIIVAGLLLALVSFADHLFVQKKMWFSPRIR